VIKVVLFCNGGASTGILVKNIQEAARIRNVSLEINAFPDSKIGDVVHNVDVILFGPQIGFKKTRYQNKYIEKADVMEVIDPVVYGLMNGEKVLDQILTLYKED